MYNFRLGGGVRNNSSSPGRHGGGGRMGALPGANCPFQFDLQLPVHVPTTCLENGLDTASRQLLRLAGGFLGAEE